MSLAFGREPSCVYRPMFFHGHSFPQHTVSSPTACLPVASSEQSGSELHGHLANEQVKSNESHSVQ